MTHAALAPRIGREFDPFLFASIGEDRHGQLLSVIAALGRSGLDAWQEAIDIAQMSGDLATARLSRLTSRCARVFTGQRRESRADRSRLHRAHDAPEFPRT